jgi:spore coat protein CotH
MNPFVKIHGLLAGCAFAAIVLAASPAHAQNNPGDSVLSGIQIHKINIVFPLLWNGTPGDTAPWTTRRNTMRTNKEPEIYIPAKLEINCDATRANPGCVLMDSVGVRYKGNSTFSTSREKNPFRFSFDEYGIDQRWNGMKGFILNNANMDPSHMAEKIHMDFAVERAGMPGPRFAYANVYVNGFPYSFYLLGELADGRLLKTNFGENDGDLFKAIDGTSNNSDFSTNSFNGKRYENKSDSVERAWARLGTVITAVNGANVATTLPSLVNLNSIYRAFAADVLLGSTDSYMGVGQNYLLYFPEAPGSKMEWILWDASLSFGKAPFGDANNSSTTPGGNCARSATGNILCGPTNKPLINKIVTTQTLREEYLRAFWFLYKAYFEDDWMTKRIDSVASVIRPHLETDRYRIGLTNMGTFDNNVTTLKTFVANRKTSVNSQFVTHGISAATAIRNTDIVINEIAPTHGWVEVYNNRDYAIDLAGHSLSNDAAQPNKWTFTSASFVQPRGYRKVRLQGGAGTDTATNFTLSASGGHLRLSRANGTVVDSVTFGTVANTKTYARATDGSGAFVEGVPTPGAANVNAADVPANIAAGLVRINELMADNDTIASPATVKADWVELYNTSSSPVDLGGRFLTDNPNNPAKWKFPVGTTIAANGYLVVWAYDTTVTGALFASWALSKSGEHVRLSNADSSVVDSVTFGAQTTSRTFARIPNGTGAFSSSCLPTLGMANTCVVVSIAGGSFAAGREGLTLARGGAGRIAARFTLSDASAVRLSVLDTRGREVALLFNGRLGAGMHERVFDPGALPSGTYIFRLRAGGVDHVRSGVIMKGM